MATIPPSGRASEGKRQIIANGESSSELNRGGRILETDVPLSESLIWRRQREYYIERGLAAWTEDLVPQYITNNTFIAEMYARIVAGFIFDCVAQDGAAGRRLTKQNPLRIVELGAGAGKFSYLFLRHLMESLREREIPPEIVRYCMTDCSGRVVEGWRANRQFNELVECGALEFSLFEIRDGLDLEFSPGDLSHAPEKRAGPLVVIANYVFDSIPQDAFVIQDGRILEAVITTRESDSSNENAKAGTISDLQLSYKNVEVPAIRYPEASWNKVLDHYRGRLDSATVLFPSGALKTLQRLGALTDGRMLVLTADKGFAHEEQLALLQGPPTIEFHAPNCFSQTVNFDAIGRQFEQSGGAALKPDKYSTNLSICAFLQGRAGEEFTATTKTYREALDEFGPDDLFAMMSWMNAHLEEVSVHQILAILRLTRWDPVALMQLFPVLARQLRTAGAERQDLRNAVLRTWANHFPVSAGDNILAFQCGVILLELKFFEEALAMFEASQKVLGGSAAASYNLGLCALGLGRRPDALAYMVQASDLDPGFAPAKDSRRRIEEEIRQANSTKR